MTTPGMNSTFPDSNYEVFDPLNWYVRSKCLTAKGYADGETGC